MSNLSFCLTLSGVLILYRHTHCFNVCDYCRSAPFANGPKDNPDIILRRINEDKLKLTSDPWRSVSKEAKDLVSRMLAVEPAQRPTAQQILQHPWMTNTSSRVQGSNLQQYQRQAQQTDTTLKVTSQIWKRDFFLAAFSFFFPLSA